MSEENPGGIAEEVRLEQREPFTSWLFFVSEGNKVTQGAEVLFIE